MNKFIQRILTNMGVNVEENTVGDTVLSSSQMEKQIDKYDSHGPCTRERVQLVAKREAGSNRWLVESFTERAAFTETLANNEIDVVTPVAKRHVGSFGSSLSLLKAFRDHRDQMAVLGYGAVRQHQMDVVRNDNPKAQIFKLG